MHIDHVGVVVKSLAGGITQWKDVFGYAQQTEPVLNTRQKVRVVFMVKDGSLPVKLVEPAGRTSPVYRFARKGGGSITSVLSVVMLRMRLESCGIWGCVFLLNPSLVRHLTTKI